MINFNEYYHTYYLPKHTMQWTRVLHLIGVIFTFAWIIASMVFSSGWALAGMLMLSPFVVYPFAWTSHLICEPAGNKVPAALTSNPLMAKAGDLRMCYEILTGKLDWGKVS